MLVVTGVHLDLLVYIYIYIYIYINAELHVLVTLLKILLQYWLAAFVSICVTVDPGSKPDQKYARRRDRQKYVTRTK